MNRIDAGQGNWKLLEIFVEIRYFFHTKIAIYAQYLYIM